MTEVAIRAAETGDVEGIARAHADAWRAAFTFLPARFLEGMPRAGVVGKWHEELVRPDTALFVAVDDEVIAGLLHVRADGDDGEVMALYVDPPRWGQGVGSALLAFGETWLAQQGVAAAVLLTARDSQQSRGFYERRGWTATGRQQTEHLGPDKVVLHEVEYRKSLT